MKGRAAFNQRLCMFQNKETNQNKDTKTTNQSHGVPLPQIKQNPPKHLVIIH